MHAARIVLIACACAAAPMALASHADGAYDQPVFIHWNTAVIDVLVVPPSHGPLGEPDPAQADPYANAYFAAVMESIGDWKEGIAAFGPAWLSDGLVLNVHVVGRDEIPEEALRDPEIIATTAEEQGIWGGIAISYGSDEEPACILSNTKISATKSPTGFSYREMYSLNAHEFGHCLGLDHPGADSPESVDFHPVEDIMAYGPLSWTKCVSNLNVLGLELIYGPVFGHPGGDVASLPVGSYQQYDCTA